MKRARLFLVADKILSRPAKAWLQGSKSFDLQRDEFGVSIFAGEDARVVTVDPESFSMPALGQNLRDQIRYASELKIIAPTVVQYFASGMNVGDPIFDAIDQLSKYPIAVENAPVFRMLHDGSIAGPDRYKHRIMFGAFPLDTSSIRCQYLGTSGEVMDVEDLNLKGVEPVAAPPLVFYHSGFSEQGFAEDRLIRLVDDDFDYERVAFDELMLRFPSRNPDDKEVGRLAVQLKLDELDVRNVWAHNRAQWDDVRQKLKTIGFDLPAPVTSKTSPEYHQFTHLVMSGALKLLTSLDATPSRIRYVGIPLFARNGVTIPLGPEGIVRDIRHYTADTLNQRIQSLLPIALKARFSVDVVTKPSRGVVRAA